MKTGEKLKAYRMRKGISQLDLEVELGASSGSISRLESGKINPTKETLFKISEVLNLMPEETADLFGIRLNLLERNNFKEFKEASKITYEDYYEYFQNLDIKKVFQNIASELNQKGYSNVNIYILNEKSGTLSLIYDQLPDEIRDVVKQIVRKDIYEIEYSLKDNTIITRALNAQEIQSTKNIFELLIPHLGEVYAVQIKNEAKEMVALPLILDSKILGCITVQSKKAIGEADLNQLKTIIAKLSKAIFTLKLKGEDTKRSNRITIFSHLREFFQFENVFKLLKYDMSMQIFLTIFVLFSSYWLINQIYFKPESYVYKFWGDVYYFMAFVSFVLGIKTIKFVGKNNKVLKLLLVILTIISLTNIFGQTYNSVYGYINNLNTFPYPSISDVGFLSGSILHMFIAIYIFNYIRQKVRNITKVKYFVIGATVAFLTLSIKYFFLINAYKEIEQVDFFTIAFDSIYIISECLGVLFSVMALILINKSMLSKETTYFLSLFVYSSILLFFCDLVFSFQYYTDSYVWGGEVDFLYFLYYSLIAFGHVALLATIKRDAAIKMEGMELKDYRYAVDKVVKEIVS